MVKFRSSVAKQVKLSGAVAIEAFASAIVDFVKDDVLHKPESQNGSQFAVSSEKLDYSLIRYICSLIETVVVRKTKTDAKVDKKQVAKRVYEALAGHALTEAQWDEFSRFVEDAHSSGAIKPVSLWRRFRKGVSGFLRSLFA